MRAKNVISSSSEAELIQRLRAGEPAAMEEFYNLYRDRLHSLILEQLGRDQGMAEDLLQEIFLAALSSIHKFRGDSQLYTWLCSIALHKITDFHRRQAKEAKTAPSLSQAEAKELPDIPDEQSVAGSAIECEETRQTVRQALTDLPSDYREVLELKYMEEKPVNEISRIMGRSPKSVEGLLSRARKALRTSLKESKRGK